jgi:hypothetical protein
VPVAQVRPLPRPLADHFGAAGPGRSGPGLGRAIAAARDDGHTLRVIARHLGLHEDKVSRAARRGRAVPEREL